MNKISSLILKNEWHTIVNQYQPKILAESLLLKREGITLTFWTTETLELMNITAFGGLEVGQYPISIYNPILRGFFTFIIPLACVAYYPIATALNHETIPMWLGTIAPLAGLIFLYFSIKLWRLGVRHYNSTGS